MLFGIFLSKIDKFFEKYMPNKTLLSIFWQNILIFACVRAWFMLLSQSNIDLPSWSSGSRRRPLTAETRVRFPMGVPNKNTSLRCVFLFQVKFRESNGRISAQSSELCARPGVIMSKKQQSTCIYTVFCEIANF